MYDVHIRCDSNLVIFFLLLHLRTFVKPRSRSGSSKVAMMKAPRRKYLKPRFIFISGGQDLRSVNQVLDYLMDVKSGILADAITDERRLEFFRNNAKKTKAAKEGWEKL